MSSRLEIRANRFQVGKQLLFLAAISIIWLFVGWTEFGPGAPGDTKTNGNSILAFWFMRILLAGCFVGALFALQYQWQLWRSTPILFILSNKGVTDRDGIYRSWAAFEDAFISKGTLYLKLSSESGSKTIIVEPNEIGFSATDKMITHIRKNAPPELSTKL